MKSQAQLQHQTSAAAIAKKSGPHAVVNNGRRLRRNVDVVVNALAAKNRSQSSNLTQQTAAHVAVTTTSNMQQQLGMQYFHRKQNINSSGVPTQHSHSQHVLDNSQAIQAKINIYSNQASSKMQQAKLSPITMKDIHEKIVPAPTKALAHQRQNQTPTPNTQQQPLYTTEPSSYNLQHQLANMVNKRNGDRNGALQNLHTTNNQLLPNNITNLSNYYDIGSVTQTVGGKVSNVHSSSAQNLELVPRAASQLSAQQVGNQQLVQIKGPKSNRNNGYKLTLSNRQNSTKKVNQNKTLYSQISMKEIQSPVKQFNVASKANVQKMTGSNFYGESSIQQQKYVQQKSQGQHGFDSNSAQAFVQYTQQPNDSYITNLKDIQQIHNFMEGLEPGGEENKIIQRSRNISNVVTTNGVAAHHNTGHSGQGGAILNINTASDINIYNNSFIVKTSPHNKTQQSAQTKPNQTNQRQTSLKRGSLQKQQQRGGKNASSLARHQAAFQPSDNNQNSLNQAGGVSATYGVRSMSTGRKKSAQGTRGLNLQNGSTAQAKTNRVQAINEAYNYNSNYVINNQVMSVPPQSHNIVYPISQIVNQPSQFQASNVYVASQKKQGPGKSYNSTENIKRSDDSQLGVTGDKGRNNSLNRPQYNNLVSESQKRLVFAQESGITMSNKRNFKNVKKNKEIFNTQPVSDLRKTATDTLTRNLYQNQKSSVTDRSADLISRGCQKIKTKDYGEAIKLFTEVLEQLDPKNIDAIFYRGVSYLDQGNLQQSISELWRVIDSKDSEDPHKIELCQQAYVLLSIAHKRLGENQNAIQDLLQCIEQFPTYSEAYLARGQTLLLQEDFSEALVNFQTYIKLNKDPFSGYLGVGDCQKAKKNFFEATQAYTKAIKLLPQQKNKANYEQLVQQCYMKRGLSSYHEGKHQQALTDLQTVILKDTSNVKAHFYIGKLLALGVENMQSKQTDAVLHFEQVAKYPEQEFYCGNALFQIAKLRLRQKDYYEAFYCLKRAADNNFSSKRLSLYKDFTEGVLYLIKRKIKKGVQILSDLLEILVNKDKEDKKSETQEDDKATLDHKKRQANKMHANYLIHQIYLFRAYGYVAIEKYEIAQEDIRRVAKYGKVDAATIYNKWLGKGILRMDHEDYLMASKFFSKAWKKYPANKDPYCLQVISIVRSYSYSLGGYFVDQQIKFDKVMETKKFMDKAISNCCAGQQKEPSLYFFRGLLNFQMHHFYEALADFNKAIDIEEESSAYFFLARGRTYACLSILNEAMKDLSVALNLDETLQQAYIYRGKCAYLIGDNNLAFLDFQRLILTDPKNPMVHVYAGNLLMTTGAYQDAIKAYENADTVEPTTISAFQRIRCFCALSDLANAKVLMNVTQEMQPDDVILKFDGICIDELLRVAKVSEAMTQPNITPADVKNTDKILTQAIVALDDLINTYESDKLLTLKRRDSILNIQVIPNLERIKIEKAMVARDINLQKDQLPSEQRADLPSLSIDLNEKFDAQELKRISPFSYYYENIFNIEDFFLYRGVFKFYQQRYGDAVVDFERALVSHKESNNYNFDPTQKSRQSGLNTKNPTLQHFTIKSGLASREQTILSNNTDLSDIGLSSFNDLEITYNILLCHLMANDQSNAFNKLNELQRKMQKKYSRQVPLLRIVTLSHFGENEKVKTEISKLQKSDPELYNQAFCKGPFLIEVFPSENRLCSKFPLTNLRLNITSKSSPLANSQLQIRLSFSMPFIKPPNMIPNVDEDSVQGEFNLKQIDAPMPEAPWIKRCDHGINFTNHITKDGKDREKFKKFFEEKAVGKNKVNGLSEIGYPTTGARLLNNMVGEAVSDRHKLSLADDTSLIVNDEDNCQEAHCPVNNTTQELNLTQEDAGDSEEAHNQDSNESYDSEEMMEKEQAGVVDIRKNENLIPADRDSLVNMGENTTKDNIRELRKMKQEIVEPNLGSGPVQLLPKVEEKKTIQASKRTLERYAQFSDENDEINPSPADSLQQRDNPQKSQISASQQLARASQAEPLGLNKKMLAGPGGKARKRERRVSNLSIGEFGLTATPKNLKVAKEKGNENNQKKNGAQAPSERRSLFRTSIDNDFY